jgi:hypothetical protein
MIVCALYAFRVNARLPSDNPRKRNFKVGAILLAPITWPFFLLASITVFILRALVYTVFLVLFAFALLAIRKPFLLVWLHKTATRIGDKLLEANSFLIKAFWSRKFENPPPS